MSKRHKQLEKSFGLPSLEELDDDELDEVDEDDSEEYEEELSTDELENKIRSLQKKLSTQEELGEITVENTVKYNSDVDELYQKAKDGYDEIFQAALSMEPSQGAKFLNGAAKLLEIALKSKNSTMEKQLEMAKLQLDREKMQQGAKPKNPRDIEDMEDDEGDDEEEYVYDRNELISKFAKRNKDSKDE